jgi:GTP pyrophosphokinase
MPNGATAVDFAYAIHTSVGNTCIGARINGKMAPIKTILHNGDQVNIITSPYQHPEATWEKFVVTGKARSCIKKFIKSREKTEFFNLGLYLTKRIFSKLGFSFNENFIDYRRFSSRSLSEFYRNLAKSNILISSVKAMIQEKNIASPVIPKSDMFIDIMDFTPGIAVHFAECCHPIPGDKIVAVLVPQKGLMVHMVNCDQCGEIPIGSFIKVKWNKDDNSESTFSARLRIVLLNKTESLLIIMNIISSNGASITNIRVEHRSIDFFDILVDIRINSVEHLGEVQAALRTSGNVRSVYREDHSTQE